MFLGHQPTYPKNVQTFVVQCDEDYRLLMKLVVDTTEALGRRGRIIGWFRPKGQPSPQPIDPAEVIHDVNEGFSVPDPDLPS